MTSLLGIKASGDDEGIILAADTRIIFTSRKSSDSKIYRGRNYAIGVAGNIGDKYLDRFFNYLSGKSTFQDFFRFVAEERKESEIRKFLYSFGRPPPAASKRIQDIAAGRVKTKSPAEEILARYLRKDNPELPKSEVDEFVVAMLQKAVEDSIPLENAIELGYFMELDLLNRYYCTLRQREDDKEGVEQTTELLVACNRKAPGLYHVNNRGVVEECSDTDDIHYLCLGSGSESIKRYFDEEEYKEDPFVKKRLDGKISLDNITLRTAGLLALGALERAVLKDKESGDYIELVQVLPQEIISHLDFARNFLQEAKYRCYEEILGKLKPVAPLDGVATE